MSEPDPNTDTEFTSHRAARPAHSAIGLGTDGLLVILFAVLGNTQHDSGLTPSEVWSTAWPFLLGLGLGWLVTLSWHSPSRIWPHGVAVLIVTVVTGMVLRELFTDGGIQLSFIIVACSTLGVLLLGRRLITRQLLPRR